MEREAAFLRRFRHIAGHPDNIGHRPHRLIGFNSIVLAFGWIGVKPGLVSAGIMVAVLARTT